jgi:hypothetical protein
VVWHTDHAGRLTRSPGADANNRKMLTIVGGGSEAHSVLRALRKKQKSQACDETATFHNRNGKGKQLGTKLCKKPSS